MVPRSLSECPTMRPERFISGCRGVENRVGIKLTPDPVWRAGISTYFATTEQTGKLRSEGRARVRIAARQPIRFPLWQN
jgi:hypothetical protein